MSPISPVRPAPPSLAPTGPKALAPETMGLLVQAADRNRDGYLGRDEATFTRTGGTETAAYTNQVGAALDRGNGFLSGFRLLADQALAIADRFARGDAWVSKEDLTVSDAARQRLDTNGDGRLARHELATGLEQGGLAINATELRLSSEIVATRPVAARPLPPAVATTSVADIRARFDRQLAGVSQIYNASSMTRDQYDAEVRRFANDALRSLLNDTKGAPLGERQSLLNRIYNATGAMTNDERVRYDQRLAQDALSGLR